MKRLTITTYILFAAVLAGCYPEKGNYQYRDLKEVTISGMDGSYSRIQLLDSLKIEPAIAISSGGQESDFEHYWIVMKSATVIDTIARTRSLNYHVSLPVDNYQLFYRLVDKNTKVSWKAKTNFTVGAPFSTGILLMGEDGNGNSEIDVISMVKDTMVLKSLWSLTDLPPAQGPLTFLHTGGAGTYMKLWAFTNSGSYYLNRTSLKGLPNNGFGALAVSSEGINTSLQRPVALAPQIIDRSGAVGSSTVRAIATADGNIFATTFSSNGGDFYGNPINRDNNHPTTRLKASPFMMYPLAGLQSMVWYDTDNDRFMYYPSFAQQGSIIMNDEPGDEFPWNQAGTGRKLVYAENTRNSDGGSVFGNSFAILKDDNNQFFIYKFYASGAVAAKRNAYSVESTATDFDKANFYAFSSNRSVLFYSVGNKLYGYDYDKDKLYLFPQIGTDEITMLKFDTQINAVENSIYVGTYNTTNKGMLKRYLVGSNPDLVEITPVSKASWSGLVKIKSMNWRAVN